MIWKWRRYQQAPECPDPECPDPRTQRVLARLEVASRRYDRSIERVVDKVDEMRRDDDKGDE